MGERFQWKSTGQCSRGDSCSFTHGEASRHRRHGHGFYSGQRAQSSSCPLRTPTQTGGKKLHKHSSTRGASPSRLMKGSKPCKDFLQGRCTEPSCDAWHPHACLNYKSESVCKYGDRCDFRHTEADGQPSKKSKKSGGKGSVRGHV